MVGPSKSLNFCISLYFIPKSKYSRKAIFKKFMVKFIFKLQFSYLEYLEISVSSIHFSTEINYETQIRLSKSAQVAVAKYHRLNGLNGRPLFFTELETGLVSPRSRC